MQIHKPYAMNLAERISLTIRNGIAYMALFPMLSGLAQLPPQAVTVTNSGGTGSLQEQLTASIYEQIEQSEYEIHWQPGAGAFMAPNRANNLRFTFHDDGFTVMPREFTNSQVPWQATFRLTSYGRVGAGFAVIDAPSWTVTQNTARAESSGIAIDYINDRNGTRQDFLIARRPTGSGPLVLNFAVDCKSVSMEVDPVDNSVYLVGSQDSTQGVARYGDLSVFDANQQPLGAKMTLIDDRHFSIIVNDQGAQYPLFVDPTLVSDGYINTPGSNMGFGYCVAYFLAFTPTAAQPLLAGNDPSGGILVGAPFFDSGSASQAGKVFYYDTANVGLPGSPSWSYAGTQAYEHLGWVVADAGYVMTTLLFDGVKRHSILVGAPGYNSQAGAAFLFSIGSDGTFGASPVWTMPGRPNANLGWSVAGVGDVNGDGWDDIVLGAPAVSYGYNYNGQAMAYYGGQNGPGTSSNWWAYGVGNYGQFGTSIAGGNVNGDGYRDIIVGAVGDPSSSAGNAYVYIGSSGGLGFSPASTLLGQTVGDQFGYSVASGFNQDNNANHYDAVLVGAPDASNSGLTQNGKVYLYHGNATGVDSAPVWVAGGGQSFESFGTSVAGGDVNNDGYADVIAGSPGYTFGGLNREGKIYVLVTDPTTGLPRYGGPSAIGLNSGQDLGTSVAYAPKLVNRDVDIIAGGPGGLTIGVQVWKYQP